MRTDTCIFCGEKYTDAELTELREMGEQYFRDQDGLICPDCWDKISRMPLEQRIEKFIEMGENHET